MGHQKRTLGRAGLAFQNDGRRKAAQNGRDRPGTEPFEAEGLAGLRQFQHLCGQHFVAVGVQQAHSDGNDLGRLVRLTGGRRIGLRDGQNIVAALPLRFPCFFDAQTGRARLRIPKFELGHVAACGIFKHLQPVFDCGGIAIVAVKIQIQRRLVPRIAHQSFEHADHFGALFVDRRGVEIVDLDKAFGARRMGQRAAVFAKLPCAQGQHIFDALNGMAAHVARKLLIAKNGQPLFQTELEPVAAGDAVSGPVVKIFVGNDAFDILVIGIGGGLRAGQHEFGVEDVQPLVFHRAHVEIVHRDDVEQIQIIFAPIDLFVPAHGADQTVHGIGAAVFIAVADPDGQIDAAPRSRGELIAHRDQIARDKRKKIGRFGPRIIPFGPAGARAGGVSV